MDYRDLVADEVHVERISWPGPGLLAGWDLPPYGFLEEIEVRPVCPGGLLPNMDASNRYRLTVILEGSEGEIPLEVTIRSRGVRDPLDRK